MEIRVLMSSGDEDLWSDVDDAMVRDGSALLVVSRGDRVVAIYAPGMWMRVEYLGGEDA